MSKERLKEMQHMIGMFDGDVEITLFGHKINSEYVMGEIKWLYQQVQKLEAIIEQDERQAVLEGLYEQNKRYREALFKMDDYDIELGDMREDMQEKLLQIKYIKDKALEESK